MDAVKFIEETRRMYKVTGKHLPTLAEGIPAEDVVKEVEEWAAAHPRKTRKSVFLEQYPELRVAGPYMVSAGAVESIRQNFSLSTSHPAPPGIPADRREWSRAIHPIQCR